MSTSWENLIMLSVFSFPLVFVLKWSWVAVLLIKIIALILDIVLLPIHVIVGNPLKNWRVARRIRAKRENESDPDSPYIRIGEPLPFDPEIINSPTIDSWFEVVCRKYGNKKCMGHRPVLGEMEEKQANGKVLKKYLLADEYVFTTFAQVQAKVEKLVNGLARNGVKSGDKVALFAETREEWMLSALALWKMNATVATMYANLGLEGILAILEQTKATHIITSEDCLDKIANIADKLTHLKDVIYAHGVVKRPVNPILTQKFTLIPFHELLEDKGAPVQLDIVTSKGNDISCIMYTSGSTGIPKGVQISHANFMAAIKALLTTCSGAYKMGKHEAFLAYLPLAHIFEMGAEVLMLTMGVPICYSSPMTMLNSSTAIKHGTLGDIGVVRPTIMPAVPLILERIKKTVEDRLAVSPFSQELFKFAFEYKRFWTQYGFETPLVDKYVFSKLRAPLGGELKMMFVGGAPLSVEIQEFTAVCIGVTLLQGYAATEGTASACLMDMDDRSYGRVGAPLFGAKLKLLDWEEGNYSNNDKPHPRGELIVGGPAITMGYYMNEEETKKVYWVDEDGTRWWRSGDIGEVFEDGTVKIIDRKKDLVKLQHGEYISLGKVESVLKSCPYVENVCVYGDSFHNNVIAIILPDRKGLKRLAESLGKGAIPLDDLCSDPQIIGEVLKTVKDFSQSKGLLRFEVPTKIKLCSEEWTPDNGLVTAALKIKRLQIQQFYKDTIKTLYSER